MYKQNLSAACFTENQFPSIHVGQQLDQLLSCITVQW